MSARTKFVGGGGGWNPKKAAHKYKKGLPHAEKLAKNILLKYSYIFASEKVIQNAPNYTLNKHSGEYAPMYPCFFCCCVRILIDRKKT